MSDRSLTMSLSRWHNVATRLAQIAEQHAGLAASILGGTRVHVRLGDEQVRDLQARGKKALDSLATARSAQAAVGAIRHRLAQANSEHGVTALLAEAESLRRQAALLRRFSAIDLVTKVPVHAVNGVLAEMANRADRYAGREQVEVALVETSALASLDEEAMGLELMAVQLTDQAAEINRSQSFSLALPENVATLAAL